MRKVANQVNDLHSKIAVYRRPIVRWNDSRDLADCAAFRGDVSAP
jgi:hypothetical protein